MSANFQGPSCETGGVVVKGVSLGEKTYVDTLASIFSDVLPQHKSGINGTNATANHNGINKPQNIESVIWARMQKSDTPDELFTLIIGYWSGVQVWKVTEGGEATEVLSLRGAPVKVFKKLPRPEHHMKLRDKFYKIRPLAIFAEQLNITRPGIGPTVGCEVKWISLKTGENLNSLQFNWNLQDITVNSRVSVAVFQSRLAVFDNLTLEHLFSVTSCCAGVGPNFNPVALGQTWLAYPDKRLVTKHQSGGGVSGDGHSSYAATIVKNASYTLSMGWNLISHMTGTDDASQLNCSPSPVRHRSPNNSFNAGSAAAAATPHGPGIVTIVDLLRVSTPASPNNHVLVDVDEDASCEEIVAHFPAYSCEFLAAINICQQNLVVTAGDSGQIFNVFKVHAHPWNPALSAVHHLYALKRGETMARIHNISVSDDSRWVAVSSYKGTIHVFAINPYGGKATARTHCGSKVVNKEGKFYCSAGLDDVRPAFSHISSSPAFCRNRPGSPSYETQKVMSKSSLKAVLNGTASHPRIPPYPHPTQVEPAVQIRTLPQNGTSIIGSHIPVLGSEMPVFAGPLFAPPCFNLEAFNFELSSSNHSSDNRSGNLVFSLYSYTSPGILVEHSVRVGRDLQNKEAVEVTYMPIAQWTLTRCSHWEEVKLPNSHFGIDSGCERPIEDGIVQEDTWLSQVEMDTHAPPHRRLWMGPQFCFKRIVPPPTSPIATLDPNASPPGKFEQCDKFNTEQLKMASKANGRTPLQPSTPPRKSDSSSSTASSPSNATSQPVPIGQSHRRSGLGSPSVGRRHPLHGGRHRSDGDACVGSAGSSGNSYPFYIEVGSGSYEKSGHMLRLAGNAATGGSNSSIEDVMDDDATSYRGLHGRMRVSSDVTVAGGGGQSIVGNIADAMLECSGSSAATSLDNDPYCSLPLTAGQLRERGSRESSGSTASLLSRDSFPEIVPSPVKDQQIPTSFYKP